MTEKITILMFQLAIIIFAAWLTGELFKKMRLPSVLGEILAGTLIGPYALGSVSLPGFPEGLFAHLGAFPVSVELYSLAVMASIILLFMVGLETDTDTFLQYSFTGSVLGIGGVLISFIAGDLLGVLFCRIMEYEATGPFSSVPLFLGVISTATSVGISARVLSENNKANSPEGVAIISAAVIDDVLGIIILAIVIGIAKSSHLSGWAIGMIALKAIGIWLGFTVVGLMSSRYLSRWLKKLESRTLMAVLSFGLALIISGIFEKAGLAMIIGAYVTGISLSKTDVAFVIQRRIQVLHDFFVPVFFCVMGMLIDIKEITSLPILIMGSIYVVLAVSSKILGCGVPALMLNFNMRGALRIGVGMVPRGEVALIIAGVGLASGIIGHDVFSLAIFMTFLTTLIGPPFLDFLMKQDGPVLRKSKSVGKKKEERRISLAMPNPETAELVLDKILRTFEFEGYYIHRMALPNQRFHIRKNDSFLLIDFTHKRIEIECLAQDAPFVNLLVYEVFAELERVMKQLQSLAEKDQIGKDILAVSGVNVKNKLPLSRFVSPHTVSYSLKGTQKKEIFEEMLNVLMRSGQIEVDWQPSILKELTAREELMSTGMEHGIAIPHIKTRLVKKVVVALGISKEGIQWETLDGLPVSIVLLMLIPEGGNEPYLNILSEFSRILADPHTRQKLLSASSNSLAYEALLE